MASSTKDYLPEPGLTAPLKPPSRRWWLDPQTRDDFDAAARREQLRMRGSRFARWHTDIRTDEDR